MKSFRSFVLCVFVLLFGLSACNLGVKPPSEGAEVVEAATEAPVVELITETMTPVVEHVMVPGELPDVRSGLAGDNDSSTTADENRASGGDRFTFDRFERPFNSTTMDVYFPYLDIQSSEIYQDDTWMYGVITVKDGEADPKLGGRYGFEIDLNLDGGGDWLILAIEPSSTEWTTNGVQVWFDENDDVGGNIKVTADDTPPGSNGYETMVFSDGQGDDPDLAWVRVSPEDPNTVQFAVKTSILGGNLSYMVGMWAGNDAFDPARFDLNDALTHEQAGASLKELEYFYPIKELSELDNVCRMAVGFQPTGSEPGICPQPVNPGNPDEPPPPPPGTTCPPPSILYCSPNGCFCLEPQG